MSNGRILTIDFVSPEDVSLREDIEDDMSYMDPLIDAVNDGLITEPGTYEVEMTKKNDQYTFEVLSK